MTSFLNSSFSIKYRVGHRKVARLKYGCHILWRWLYPLAVF